MEFWDLQPLTERCWFIIDREMKKTNKKVLSWQVFGESPNQQTTLRKRIQLAQTIERTARICVPLYFITFNATYWLIFLL